MLTIRPLLSLLHTTLKRLILTLQTLSRCCITHSTWLMLHACRPQDPVLDDIEAQVVSAVWLKLGREPTLGEVVRELPPYLPCHPDVEVYRVLEDSPMLVSE